MGGTGEINFFFQIVFLKKGPGIFEKINFSIKFFFSGVGGRKIIFKKTRGKLGNNFKIGFSLKKRKLRET